MELSRLRALLWWIHSGSTNPSFLHPEFSIFQVQIFFLTARSFWYFHHKNSELSNTYIVCMYAHIGSKSENKMSCLSLSYSPKVTVCGIKMTKKALFFFFFFFRKHVENVLVVSSDYCLQIFLSNFAQTQWAPTHQMVRETCMLPEMHKGKTSSQSTAWYYDCKSIDTIENRNHFQEQNAVLIYLISIISNILVFILVSTRRPLYSTYKSVLKNT